MEFTELLNILKEYDLPTILMGISFYVFINKKLNTVDKAVNCRTPDSMTISQEVSEIHRQVDMNATTQARNIEYIKNEMDRHRELDERTFVVISRDIKSLNKRVTVLSKIKE